jgi:hypothetical protein
VIPFTAPNRPARLDEEFVMPKQILLAGLLMGVLWLAGYTLPGTHAAPATQPPPVSAEAGEQIARRYLQRHASAYGLSAADLAGFVAAINFADTDSGNRYVKFTQHVGGIEVYNAMVNVTLRGDGSVLYVGNRGISEAARRVNSDTPRLSQAEAIAAAATALGIAYDPATVVTTSPPSTVAGHTRFTGGTLSYAPITVRLLYHPHPDGSLRLAWMLDLYERNGAHWWDIQVDALSGAVLAQTDRVITDVWSLPVASDGFHSVPPSPHARTDPAFAVTLVAGRPHPGGSTYRVYAMPVESPSHATPPAPADGRTLAANPSHPTASPYGWHDTNGSTGPEYTVTRGNNVYAYTDIDANNLPDPGSSPDGGGALFFDAPLDLTLPPEGYRPAAVTNLFYWANLLHDVAYLHGFTEAAGNFQENNYGNGGLGNDAIHMQAQDGALFNNARYFHAPDGSSPSVEMFVFTPATPDRDSDLDSGIILHEYGHGISLRLTGNGVSCLDNAEQMGEGWSDFEAVMLTQKAGDPATLPRGLGTYVVNQPPTGPGVRVAPYTTDMSMNPYTYGDLPDLQGGSPLGFLWNTMLWDLNWTLIDRYGFNPDLHGDWTTGGNNLTYRLVHDGLKIQPCTPGFEDGRDAILAAEEALTGGVNQCLIWHAFARRGLGYSASQGSPHSTTDGTEAFDLPPSCSGVPEIQVTPEAIEAVHTEPQTAALPLELRNIGTGTLIWELTEAQTAACGVPTDLLWMGVSPVSGTIPVSGTATVSVTLNSVGLANGRYAGDLCVATNDPVAPIVAVPVVLHVGPATAIEVNALNIRTADGVKLGAGVVGLLVALGLTLRLRPRHLTPG